MIRLKQALKSARSRILNLLPASKTRRTSARVDAYMQSPHHIPSTYSTVTPQQAALALSNASAHSQSPSSQGARVRPLDYWTVPATLTVDRLNTLVCKFSHGSGLIVYMDGALMTAARVALKVNIATLNFVKKLPLDELGAIGGCLAAAFADAHETVEITYCEMDEEEEEAWRWAEREWEVFPGGPYETHELSYFGRSVRQTFNHGSAYEGATLFARRCMSLTRLRPCDHVETSSSQYSFADFLSGSRVCSEEALPLMTEAQFEALSQYEDSLSYISSDDQEAIELCAIGAPTTLRASFFNMAPAMESAPRWSPGPGSGPIMSSAQFDALPDWSDIEDDRTGTAL